MLPMYPMVSYEGLAKRKKSTFNKFVSNIKDGMTSEDVKKSKFYKKLTHKMRKTEYIERNYRNFEFKEKEKYKPKYLYNHFIVEEYNGDYWTSVYVFNTIDMEKVLIDLNIMDIEIRGSNWISPYDCTGQAFYQACDFITLSDRIIVKQSGALDV
jgi:hypothetical protein